ncbi:MAG: NusA-like transcription termination signal-binding factor [Halobacteria archaeon]|nr:NusA-like transcription termination signal-binding factor [Halobacteria archaeon]
MSKVRLTDDEMRYISLFEKITGAVVRDCVIDENYGKIIFVVKNGDMGVAIGKGGANIERVKRSIEKQAEIIEYSDNPRDFVANAFQPAAVESVEIKKKKGKRVALVEVNEKDKGLAIGKDGKNIRKVKKVVQRHYDIDDVILV